MKNNFRRALVLFLAVMMLLPSALAISVSAEETENAEAEAVTEGISFAANRTYTLPASLKTAPLTFEAVINVPKGAGRAGVIMGNYSDNVDTICFEIHENGNPRIYFKENGVLTDYRFPIDIRSDEYVHLAITVDTATKTATCYVNGEPKATKTNDALANYATYTPAYSYMIGGDCRGGNGQYFKGKIKNVALYSDLRTESEIKSDASKNMNSLANADLSGMMAGYDLTKGIPAGLKDVSGNNNHLDYSDPEYDKELLSTGLTFSNSDAYKMGKPFASGDYPTTIEATLFLPKSVSQRGGTILGNYSSDTHSMSFEIYTGGQPRVYLCSTKNEDIIDLTFNQVDIRTSGWVNVSITLDYINGVATCYVNGVAKQALSIPGSIVSSSVYEKELYLGRDTRSDMYFRGALKSMALYSDVRTADEIAADVDGVDLTDKNLICAYNFLEETKRADITGNGYSFYGKDEEIPKDDEPTVPDDGGDDEDEGGSGITTLDGLTFTSSDYAILQKTFKDNAPYTFEATILVPKDVTDRAGIILGNHESNSYKYISFEIFENGSPRFCFSNPNNTQDGNSFNYVFSDVHVNTGEALHLAITIDPQTGAARCYVDGKLKQTISKAPFEFVSEYFENYSFVLGNDPRSNSAGTQCFKGTIANVALYSSVRTNDEIAQDFQGVDLTNKDLILYYDLSSASRGEDVVDLSGNGYGVAYKTRGFADLKSWIGDKSSVTDYLYSFVIVGDTQIIAQNHSDKFHMIYDWILSNKTAKNIQYVFGLGDITNGSSGAEWNVASENIFRLNGIIPYSAVRGNHDKIGNYNNVFANNSEYMAQFDGFYKENDATNTYRLITIGETKYLMITLDYGASDSVLEWAGKIIDKYSDYKVIITTHAYLYRDGSTLDGKDVCPPATSGGYNNGDHMWDKLISQHENIFLVISGHDPSAQVVMSQQTGVHGNLVTQLLVDPQGVDTSTPTGMVSVLYVKADGTLEIETYSTIQELYYKESNQFVINEAEHNYVDVSISYENGYMAPGTREAVCSICNHAHTLYAEPLFTTKGYSNPIDGESGIAIGYSVNHAWIAKYTSLTGDEIEYGVFVVSKNKLGENDVFNQDGTKANGVISAEISSYEFASFNLKVVGFADEYKDMKLAMGAYAKTTSGENTVYSYMQSGTPIAGEKYCFISYNELANIKKEDTE